MHFSIISKVSQVSYSRNTLYTGIMQFQFLRDLSNSMIPHQNKNFGPLSAKTSLTFLTQSWRGRGGGACYGKWENKSSWAERQRALELHSLTKHWLKRMI